MTALASTSLSGMRAAQTAASTAAFNIANLGSADFRRQRVDSAARLPSGVTATVGRATTPGADLAGDRVGLLQAHHAMLANIAVFKTEDAILGTLLDFYA